MRGVRQDRTVAERSRTPLTSPGEPSDDLLARQQHSDLLLRLAKLHDAIAGAQALRHDERVDFAVVVLETEVQIAERVYDDTPRHRQRVRSTDRVRFVSARRHEERLLNPFEFLYPLVRLHVHEHAAAGEDTSRSRPRRGGAHPRGDPVLEQIL